METKKCDLWRKPTIILWFFIMISTTISFVTVALTLSPVGIKSSFVFTKNRQYIGFEKIKNDKWIEDFMFIHASDPQYGYIQASLFDDPNSINTTDWKTERKLMQKAVEQWTWMKPSFVMICGDLAQDRPSKKFSNRRRQLDDLKEDLNLLATRTPLVLASGNHDMEDYPTKQALQQFTNEFGDDYFSFWFNGVMFIVLNSQYYWNHTEMQKEYDEQNEWLDRVLKEAKYATHVVVFLHIPWFKKSLNESSDPDTIPPVEREIMVKKLYDSNVRYIFAGHWHINMEGKYKDMEMITTSALGGQWRGHENAKSGYRIVKVTKNSITHQYRNIEN